MTSYLILDLGRKLKKVSEVDLASDGSGMSGGVKVCVIQLGGGRGQAPSENKTEKKQE